MLIPIFNAIWSFIAVCGWGKLWNLNVKTHPGLANAWKIFLPVFVLFCLSLFRSPGPHRRHVHRLRIPASNLGMSQNAISFRLQILFATLAISGMVTWFQICASINFLARKKS